MTTTCSWCGAPSQLSMAVCDDCACTIANQWWKARAGAYLTWPNPPRVKKAYEKKSISKDLRAAIFERDQHRCLHCGAQDDLSVDHIVPESKGGLLSLSNLQTLCRPCNSRKGAR